MAAYTEAYAGLTNEQRSFYDLTLLNYAKKNLPHAAFGQKARAIQIPSKQGMTVQFR